MKITREIMIEAHKLAKEIKSQYPNVDYRTQVGINISYLLTERKNSKRENNEMVELIGTQKQIKWAEKIRKDFIKSLKECVVFKTPFIEFGTVWNLVTNEPKETEIRPIFKNEELSKKAINNLQDAIYVVENEEDAALFIEYVDRPSLFLKESNIKQGNNFDKVSLAWKLVDELNNRDVVAINK